MIRTASLLLLLAGAGAAELVVHDLRLGASSLPLAFDWSVTSRSGSASGSDGFDAGLGLEGGARWSFARAGDPLGLVVGADILLDGWDYAGGGSMAMTGLHVCAGPGWALSDRWTLTALVGAQYGLTRLDLPGDVSRPSFTASGSSTGYDLRIGADALLGRGFGIGLTAGWLIASHSVSGDALDVTIDQSGWFAGLAAVWRFNQVPSRLE